MEQILSQQNLPDKTNYRFFAFNILKAKAKNLFKNNAALECLAKSDYFFQELAITFGNLYQQDVTPDKFIKAVKNIKTSDTDSQRLLLIAELYNTYINIMQQNAFKLPFSFPYTCSIESAQNSEIKQRIDFLLKSFNSDSIPALKTSESKNIEYLEFSDIQSETLYIIEEIKSLVESGLASFSQIAVFIDKTEARKKFLDLVKAQKLPVISSIYNEDYENLKHKINLYQRICEVFLELKLDEFSYDAIKNINLASRAQKEICFEELDELFKTILLDVVENPYSADKVFTKKENSQKSLLETVFTLWNTFEEKDKAALSAEFNAIKNFYEDYKNNNYAKAIETLIKKNLSKFENTPVKESLLGKIKSLNDLQNLFAKLDSLPEFDSFKEIMQGLPKDEDLSKNAIFLASITTDIKKLKDIKYVYIAGLTQNNYPGANTSYPFISSQTNIALLEELKKISTEVEYFLKTDEIHFEQQLYAFCNVMELAKNKLTLATHTYEAKKQTQPSVFFKLLKDIDPKNFKQINTEQKPETIKESAPEPSSDEQTQETVIKPDDILRLNASAINTYLKCPRKYYYKNLLNLKEPYTFAASYGSIVHAVFQVLNTKYTDNYTKDTATELANILFDSAKNEDRAKQAGFSDTDIELVKAASELSLSEMKNNFYDAVADFDYSGGFDHPPVNAVCEKSFFFMLDELPNVAFDGRIDAIITDSDGQTSVIDYKTGKDKTNTLDYAVSEYGVNFKLKTGKDPSNIENLQKAYDYQIPLYYLAIQNSRDLEAFKDRVSQLGLVYIRPKSKDNGCNEDFISADRLEQYKDKIIQNLKETVIDKILAETDFKPEKSWDCDNCAYKYLCDREDN